jgi:hypothetical protein
MAQILKSKDIYHSLAVNFFLKAGGAHLFTDKERRAVDHLTNRLMLRGDIWKKLEAIYPFVGRSAKTHSINLKRNRNKIKWYGSVTHDGNGVTSNGGFGNTLYASGLINKYDRSIGVYSTTKWVDKSGNVVLAGVGYPNNQSYSSSAPGRETRVPVSTLNLRGDAYSGINPYTFHIAKNLSNKVSAIGNLSNDIIHMEAYGWINGNIINKKAQVFLNGSAWGAKVDDISIFETYDINSNEYRDTFFFPNQYDRTPITIFGAADAWHRLTGSPISNVNIRFMTIGKGLDDEQNQTLYDIIQEFQQILGRAVDPIAIENKNITATDRFNYGFEVIRLNTYGQKRMYSKIETDLISQSFNAVSVFVEGPRLLNKDECVGASVSIISFV